MSLILLSKRTVLRFFAVATVLLLALAGTINFGAAASPPAPGSVYYRPFNLLSVIGRGGAWNLTESPNQVIAQFQGFPQKPTMIGWIATNTNATVLTKSYATFIQQLQAITPHLCFGDGGDPTWNLNNATTYSLAISFAQGYRQLGTDCISFHNFDQIVKNSGDAPVLRFLTDLHNMNYTHIFTTNYRAQSNAQPWPYIDAVMTPVSKSDISKLILTKMQAIQASQPNAILLVNYEAPSELQTLASFNSTSQQISAMGSVAAQQYNFTVPFKWAAPWGNLYDAYQKGTLSWIANELASIDPPAPTTTASTLSVQPLKPSNGATVVCSVMLKVKVLSNGAVVSGATVQFYLNGQLVATTTTNLNGLASYSSCPSPGAYTWSATASSTGYGPGQSPPQTFTV